MSQPWIYMCSPSRSPLPPPSPPDPSRSSQCLKSLLNLLQCYCFFPFWLFGQEAGGILAPHQGSNLHPYTEVKVKVLVAQSYPTRCDPVDCSLPGSSVCGILQARILEWVAIPFSRGSSWPRDWTWVSCNAGSFITIWATRAPPALEGDVLITELSGKSQLPYLSEAQFPHLQGKGAVLGAAHMPIAGVLSGH